MAESSDRLRNDLSSITLSDPLARIRPGYIPVNITQAFTEACQDLETGQLAKDENFSLWDAVQALEIMDPKMDSGVIEDGGEPSDEFDVSANLLPGEIIWIMDEILCRELAWLRGFALFQTVFTSVHIHHLLVRYNRTKSLPTFGSRTSTVNLERDSGYTHTCLHAFCMSTIIQCDMNADLVTTQQYYEEEDLNTQTYGLNLCNQIGDEQCLELLDTALDWLADRKQVTSSPEHDEAIYRRLLFRRSFMSLFIFGTNEPEIETYPEQLQALLSTHALSQRLDQAFDPKAYRKLAIGAPTRTPATVEFSEAIRDLEKLCNEFHEGSFLRDLGPDPPPETVQLFLWHFMYRSTPPSTVARAKLQVQLFSQGGLFDPNNYARMKREMRDLRLIDTDILEISEIEHHHPSSPMFRKLHTMHEFMQQSFEVIIDSYKARCQNPCRIRRCLINSLEHLRQLQETVSEQQDESISEQARTAHLNGFLQQRIGWQSVRVILAGYEHQVYEDHEHGILYWIIYDTARRMSEFYQSTPEGSPSTWQAKLRAARLTQLKATAHLALGFSRMYAVLMRVGAMSEPRLSETTSMQMLWQLRIAPLAQDQDSSCCYANIRDKFLCVDKAQSGSLREIIDDADRNELEIARQALQNLIDDDSIVEVLFELPPTHFLMKRWRNELTRQKRALVQMRLELFKLKQVLADDGYGDGVKRGWTVEARIPTTEERVEKDRSGKVAGHEWWVVPSVKVKKTSDHITSSD